MTDLGQPLQFGSFLTPTSENPTRPVELAILCEQIGLDLVTFQDHPYQPAFLDTWTLLCVVAARTSTVRLAPNVANVPLRAPAVLARSVASLDLLSSGRVELGLGAGLFWDAIDAMGGRRLSPGQSVKALEEAIDVIRQMWDINNPAGARVTGEHFRLTGAKRGPAPAHPVEIWLGAYGPRMLALTGRSAEGWLPSLGPVGPDQLTEMSAAVDNAAIQADRSPRDVRRLVNISGSFEGGAKGALQGPPERWAHELARMALTDGFSAFILVTDEPDELRRYAAEVAPAVRDLVTAERHTATPRPS